MGNKKSTTSSKYSGSEKAKDASHLLKDTSTRRRATISSVQNVLLIWLDNNFNENNEDCRNTVIQLRHVINNIITFTDGDQCIQFIEDITDNKVCMIVSGSLGQQVMSRMHNMSQIDSFFIFCGNRKLHEQWARQWPKIKGVFTEISPICDALKQAAKQCEQNAIPMSFIPTSSGDVSTKKLNQLDSSFMYTQILKEILLTIKFEEKHIKQFIDYCRKDFIEKIDLDNLKKLQRKYHKKSPIWWYTYESFLYQMLNHALRTMDADVIIRIGFFINDLHRDIEQLHSKQFGGQSLDKIFTVYRGQGLSNKDFKQMTETKGGLMSFNSFLSTSKHRTIALEFASNAALNPDLVGIVFNMTIDPSKSTTPFACITDVSYFHEEDEILFSMHTTFRIFNIKSLDENNRLYEVNLVLTNDNDKDLCVLTDRIRQDTFPDSKGWYRMGLILLKMGEFDKAEEVYKVVLTQTINEREQACVYHELGRVKYNQGDYPEAIIFYEKALENFRKILPSIHLNFANCYNDMGLVYYTQGNYSKALSSYEKTLEIQQRILPPNHPDLAASYNNNGLVYYNMRDYSKALSSHEKALHIRRTLPPNHPDLAASYTNIGNVYCNIREYSKALPYHQKALEIRQQSLPPNHPDLATSYNNIGLVHYRMFDYRKAYSFYERAVDIAQHSLPTNHPNLKQWRENLEEAKKKL